MSYEISIRKIETVKKIAGKEWAVVGTEEDGKPKYGYTPETEKHVVVDQEIYRQVVDNLCIVDVINSVNGCSMREQK